ncbi:putative protein kinase RLK-Pelle-LRR-I-1 family [Helianthus annuus]|uniref:non-specific serine/threonine protein kinase n=1 Tax=Helianthus annuus TaxID=4232 RepID=A0A9K3DKI1_HELAN|nr:putative protein kinase RLK-Pelle-LRR-I-1 family [Helianthus annuus]
MELSFHVDPEYKKSHKAKRESDVYSFGVVLLEILTGRHVFDSNYSTKSHKGLVHVARRNFLNGTMEDMIDPTLKEETNKKSCIPNRGANKDSLHTFIKIANECIEETQDQRPTMKVVLKELERALFIQVHQEEPIQQLDKDNRLKITTQEIPEKGVQRPNKKTPLELLYIKAVMLTRLKHLEIPLTQIQSATNNFSEAYLVKVLFDGHRLYRADIEHFDEENGSSKRRSTVIIKRYPMEDDFHDEVLFLKEITILGTVKHPNIVTLLGFCLEASEKILVIDNFSNEFLGDYLVNLKDKRVLTWEKRLKICIDVAHALRHIHTAMEHGIINGDIWSYNICLDENLGAKIVNFWISEFLPPNQEDHGTDINWSGRQAYTDPDIKKTHRLKRASDVYSFGIVLFEILCGRLCMDPGYAHVFIQGARRGTLDVIDPIIKEETDENIFVLNSGPNKDSLHTFIEIAHKCLEQTQDQRPTMKVVVEELEKALLFQKDNKDNPRMLLEDIKRATQNFSSVNFIGRGGFGSVYKGNLQDDDGFKTIVAKRLDTKFGQGEQQFLTELQILLDYKHQNVIGLAGYCDENDEKVIIYEYLSRGSLDRYLNDSSLTWVKRLNICIDVARALDFLHGGVGKQAKVIHRDIKTENILLNDDWKAKLADFGLSLICPINKETDYIIDHACGTEGYVDPLYRQSGFLTIESDIYSFGVVLFEILCGRSTFAIRKHEGDYLPDFIRKNFKEGKHAEVVFNQIREQIVHKSLTTFQEIAYQCLHHEREKRPTTKEVLKELKKALKSQEQVQGQQHMKLQLSDIIPVHSLDRDEEGSSGPNDDTLPETDGDIPQLSNEDSIDQDYLDLLFKLIIESNKDSIDSETGKQVQHPELSKHTEQDPVSPTDRKATSILPGSKQQVLKHLKQDVILGDHQVRVLKEELHKVEMANKSRLALIQALEEDEEDDDDDHKHWKKKKMMMVIIIIFGMMLVMILFWNKFSMFFI